MSEQLQCKVAPDDSIRVSKGRIVSGDQRVDIFVCEEDSGHSRCTSVEVSRAEFLAAVASELDAVIIPREEFPEVELKNGWIVSNGAYHEMLDSVNGPDEIRREATEMLAIAEFLEANPPVDEEQVAAITDALVDAFRGTDGRKETFKEKARRLYLAGVRVGGDDK